MIAHLLEACYRLVGRHFVSAYGYGTVDDGLHPIAHSRSIGFGDRTAYVEVAIETVGYRNVDTNPCTGIQILHRPAKHEEESACIGSQSGWRRDVEILYVLGVIYAIMQTFYLVIHLGAYGRIGQSQI